MFSSSASSDARRASASFPSSLLRGRFGRFFMGDFDASADSFSAVRGCSGGRIPSSDPCTRSRFSVLPPAGRASPDLISALLPETLEQPGHLVVHLLVRQRAIRLEGQPEAEAVMARGNLRAGIPIEYPHAPE